MPASKILRRIEMNVVIPAVLLDLQHIAGLRGDTAEAVEANRSKVDAVAGNVITQLFEFTATANLPLGVDAKGPAIQEQRGQILPLAREVGIHANFSGCATQRGA